MSGAAGDARWAGLAPVLQPYARALWPAAPPLAALPPLLAAQRPCLRPGAWLLPEAWRGVRGPAARSAYLAAVAHAAAHGQHGGPPQSRQGLKPLQQALLGVLEDARVEWLACQAMPGLRELWAAQWPDGSLSAGTGADDAAAWTGAAEPAAWAGSADPAAWARAADPALGAGAADPAPSAGVDDPPALAGAEALLARLARVLLTGQADAHPWIAKARGLFHADADGRRLALADPAALRLAASRLGNDLGQMRLPFNARQYVVEPAYRDDNAHLWLEPAGEVNALALPQPVAEQAAAPTPPPTSTAPPTSTPQASPPREPGPPGEDAARDAPPHDDPADAGHDAQTGADAAGPPSPAQPATLPALRLIEQTRWPEWDGRIQRLRPGWTTVRVWQPQDPLELSGPSDEQHCTGPLPSAHDAEVRQAARRIGARLAVPGPRPRGRAADGDRLHLRAAVQARLAQRLGHPADARLYQAREPAASPLAVVLLIDTSVSTGRALQPGPSAGSVGSAVSAGSAEGAMLLDVCRQAAHVALAALQRLAVATAAHAFCSDGRERVEWVRLKSFDEPADARVAARLAALRPAGSTRIGAALRHAVSQLAGRPEARKRVILLTDGEPHDIDVHDRRYLMDDLRHAVRQAAAAGVQVACLETGQTVSETGGQTGGRLRRCLDPGRHRLAAAGLPRAGHLAEHLAELATR